MVNNSDRLRALILRVLKLPHVEIIRNVPPSASVLDIGCGNSSPTRAKALRSDIHYHGVDVQEYNFSIADRANCDRFTILEPSRFNEQLVEAIPGNSVDLVLMKHVIEHADDFPGLLRAASGLLKPGGKLYLSFPAYSSIGLRRADEGTLNFWDDPTHHVPPRLAAVVEALIANDLRPSRVILHHRNTLLRWPAWIAYWWASAKAAFGARFKASALMWHAVGFEHVLICERRCSAEGQP